MCVLVKDVKTLPSFKYRKWGQDDGQKHKRFLWIARVFTLLSYWLHQSNVCLHVFRFLYSDEVQIGPETVMTTLYTAKKYAVPALEAHCVEFLKKNLRADNAFMLLTQVSLQSFALSPLSKLHHNRKTEVFWVLWSWSSKMEQFCVILNSSLQESSADEQVLTKNNKIQQTLLPFQICFLFPCGRQLLPECELGKKLTGWKNFICQEEKWNERIFTCSDSGLV